MIRLNIKELQKISKPLTIVDNTPECRLGVVLADNDGNIFIYPDNVYRILQSDGTRKHGSKFTEKIHQIQIGDSVHVSARVSKHEPLPPERYVMANSNTLKKYSNIAYYYSLHFPQIICTKRG